MDQKQAIWIRDPLAILAEGAERGVVVRQGKIIELVAVGRQPSTVDAVPFDASEHVVLPGLINTHHHFYQTLTRALPAAMDRELFPWLAALYPVWARLTPEALDLGVTVAMSELMLSGCTTTTDHHYVFPAGLEEAVDIEVSVAKRLGLRVLLTRGSMNRSQRDGGLPPHSVVQDEDTILADSERVVARHHQRGEDAMVQIALAPCSPFSVTTSLMRATADLAKKLDVRLHTHLAETEDENRFCEATHGCRPLDYLEQCGWLNARTWLAHGIFFSAAEMKRLGKAGTSISHCACSNQVLASGCCPVCEMEEAGVGIGIGVEELVVVEAVEAEIGVGVGLAVGLLAWSRDVVVLSDGATLAPRDHERCRRHGVVVRAEKIARVEGRDGRLVRIVFADGSTLARAAIFLAITQRQRSPLAERLGCTFTKDGAVATGEHEATNVPGVYVVGDASRHDQMVAVAAAEGTLAAIKIHDALWNEELGD
jgi:8-oxoguanine deaminase